MKSFTLRTEMPLLKYRSIEEANAEPHWLPTGDASIGRRIRYLWRMSEFLLSPVGASIPAGVTRHRSIEEANAYRQRWEFERWERLQAARSTGERGNSEGGV
jgi:hypothetical protein